MAFKMKGMGFGHGTGSALPKKSGYETIRDKVNPGDSYSGMRVGDQKLTYKQLARYNQTGELPDGTVVPSPTSGRYQDYLEYMRDQPKIKDWKRKKDSKINENKEGDKQSFGDAFAAARKAGKDIFTWNGKKYHTRTKEEEAKSGGDDNKSMKKETKSLESKRPDYQKIRQERRISRRKGKAGKDPMYDARTAKKEARMKYGRNSKEFKEANQALQKAKANK